MAWIAQHVSRWSKTRRAAQRRDCSAGPLVITFFVGLFGMSLLLSGYAAICHTGNAGRAAHNASAVAASSATTSHSVSARVEHSTIAPATRWSDTVCDRVMS